MAAVFLFILFSLGVAFFSFIKKDKNSDKMLKALTVRIALSIGLIILMMVGSQFGLISPHGI
ncbi:MAG: DUF2909 domain-containing protein [Gammaproteobacteria bacterium]|nr:DUF2909 domain-containing protein [Gammaproteobacteria bacterium]